MSLKKNWLKLFFAICTILFGFISSLYSQSPKHHIGNWLMFFNQTRLHEKWSLHLEAQYRAYNYLPNPEQLLLRGGVNYHLNNSSFISLGYGSISNYAYDKEVLTGTQAYENRLWQQFTMKNKIGRINFEHRYRLEQRWIESNNNSKYLDRVRYLLRASIPLNKKEIEKNTFFLTFYDELFIHFTSNPFDRNRLYGAIALQFSKTSNFQLGYLIQTVNNINKEYFQFAINYNLDFRKVE